MFCWYLNGQYLEGAQINDLRGGKKVILFGSLRYSKRLSALCDAIGKEDIVCIFDFDEAKWGSKFEGIPVRQPVGGIDAVLLSSDYDWKTIEQRAQSLGYDEVYFYLTEDKRGMMENYIATFMPSCRENTISEDRIFKYVHLMSDNKFFIPVAEMIEYGLKPEEHFFIIYNLNWEHANASYGSWKKYEEWRQKYQNVYYLHDKYPLYLNNISENMERLDALLEQADKVLFHGDSNIYCNMEDYFASKLDLVKKKGVYLPWSSNKESPGEERSFIKRIVQYASIVVVPDKEVKRRHIQNYRGLASAKWFVNGWSYARPTKKPGIKKERTNNIFIAHSAVPIAKTVETLEYLAGLDDSCHIFSIASYGELDEIKQIEATGRTLFGDRFTAVKEFMEYDRYVEFLSMMDVAIWGIEASAGRDTLELLFWLGVKVYLKPESNMYQWAQSVGYRPDDYYSVQDLTVDELLDNPNEEWNCSVAASEFDADKKLQQWKEVYEYDWGEHK